jgi:hypothetical protein
MEGCPNRDVRAVGSILRFPDERVRRAFRRVVDGIVGHIGFAGPKPIASTFDIRGSLLVRGLTARRGEVEDRGPRAGPVSGPAASELARAIQVELHRIVARPKHPVAPVPVRNNRHRRGCGDFNLIDGQSGERREDRNDEAYGDDALHARDPASEKRSIRFINVRKVSLGNAGEARRPQDPCQRQGFTKDSWVKRLELS